MTRLIVLVAAALVVTLRLAWRRRRRRDRAGARGPRVRPAWWPSAGVTPLVAQREIRERLRARSFWVVTAIVLLVIGAAIVIPVATRSPLRPVRVGTTGPLTTSEVAALAAAGRSAGDGYRTRPEASAQAARAAVADGRVDVVLEADDSLLVANAITPSDTSSVARFVRSLSTSLGVDDAMRAAGITAAQAVALSRVRPVTVRSVEKGTTHSPGRSTSLIGVILIFVMLSQYNTWTLIGVMEEKSSRVVEVLLAAVRPIQLLAGKVLGIGLLALTQATVLVGFALALAALVGSDVLSGATALVLVSSAVWLLLGYAFYSWVSAAAGSMVERQDQVQTVALPLSVPMIIGYVAALTVASSGSVSGLFQVLAYLPPTAPFAVPVMVGLGAFTWWQFVLAAAVSVTCTVGVARVAAGVYRRAVLRTGGRVRLRQLRAEPR